MVSDIETLKGLTEVMPVGLITTLYAVKEENDATGK
jgi:hypothetical protein